MNYDNDSDEEIEEYEEEEGLVEEEDAPPLLGLCSDINEETMKELAYGLLTLNGGRVLPGSEGLEDTSDIEFFISSSGGAVNDMFAVYDLMRLVQESRDIATFGYGRVASAAVVLLAAGTAGKRYASKNARIMLHHCSSEFSGTHPTLRANFNELKKLEAMMIQILAENSNLSVGEYYNIFSRNTDEYFSAEEILEMGIVDKII